MKQTSKLAKRLALLSAVFCACGSIAWDATPKSGENSVTSLNYTQEADKTLFEIGVTSEPTFSVYTLSNPSRVVVEILDCDTATKITPLSVRNGVVDSAALSVSKSNDYQTCRVIMSLDHDADYTVDSNNGRITLAINGAPTQGDALLNSYMAKAKTSDEALARAQEVIAREQAARLEAEREAKAAAQREQEALNQLNIAYSEASARISEAEAKAESARESERQAAQNTAANNANALAKAQAERQRAEEALAKAQAELKSLGLARDAADARAAAAEQKARSAEAQIDVVLSDARMREMQIAAERDAAARNASESSNKNISLAEQNELLRAQAQQIAAERDAMAKRAAELDAAKAELARQNASLQARETQIAAERDAAARNASESSHKNISLAEQNELLRAQAQQIAAERDAMAKRAAELDAAKAELAKQNASLQARETQIAAERDAAAQRANELDSAKSSLAQQNEQLRAQISKHESEIQKLEADVQKAGAARRQIKKLEAASLTDAEAIAQRDAKIEELRAQVKTGKSAQKQLAELKAENEQLKAQISSQAATRQAPIDVVATQRTENVQVAATAPIDLDVPNTSVKDIQFRDNGDDMQVIVKLSSPASKVENVDLGNQKSVLRIADASLPSGFNKKFDTSAFKKGIRFIDSTENNGDIELIAQSTSHTVESVEQRGDTVIWNLRTLPGAYDTYKAPIDRRSNAMVSASDSDQDLAINYGKRKTLADTPFGKRKITLDIRDGEVTDLLRLLSDEINVSIVVSPDVSGRVTLSLKSVPLDQALDLILRMNDLGMKYEGDIIWVAKAETFRAEEERALQAAEVREKLEPLEVRLVPVNYATANDLSENVKSLLSSRGTVNIDARTNTLILKDVAANLDAAEILVSNLDTQTPQILIEARIVETQANFKKEIGIQWGGDGIASAATGNATGIVFPSTIGIAGGSTSDNNSGTSATPNFAVNLPASVGTGAGGAIGFTFGSVGGAINLNVRLSAMEEKGFLKIVSAPRIMTLDNIQASIESGTSIPISVVSAAGAQTVFYDAKLNLEVTPHVTRDGNVYLKINISKNEPDFGNTGASGDPSIIRKEAHTELLIPDGDTTVIGGIYTRNASQSMSSVPFFGSIPFLGYLFRNTSESDNRTELLIFITPRIINRDASIAASGPGSFVPPEEISSK